MISPKFSAFFQELSNNNHKDWFHDNKSRYEEDVKGPFKALIDRLIPQLQAFHPTIPDLSRDIIMRINRDIRFSKDKTPYNTMMKANFTPDGRKSGNPGYYLGIDASNSCRWRTVSS